MRFTSKLTIIASLVALTMPGLTMAEVSKETLKSISIADKVETDFGALEFFDGVPSDATIDKLYDNLDKMRAVQVYLDNIGAVSINSVLNGLAKAGADASNKVAVFEQLMKQVRAKADPLFMVAVGDYTRNSLLSEIEEFLRRTGNLPFPIYYVKGNHESRCQDGR